MLKMMYNPDDRKTVSNTKNVLKFKKLVEKER